MVSSLRYHEYVIAIPNSIYFCISFHKSVCKFRVCIKNLKSLYLSIQKTKQPGKLFRISPAVMPLSLSIQHMWLC